MRYVIFGSGGLAKELIAYVEEVGATVACVVSSQSFNSNRYKHLVKPELEKGEYPDALFLMGVSDPNLKRMFVERNEDRWATFIHPTATVSRYADVGYGCILAPQTIITGDAKIGDFVFMNTNSTVGHDSIVGEYSTLFPNSEICGDCDIGGDCLFGIGSYVLPKVSMPRGTKVSAGAVVRKSVVQAVTLYGDPAAPRKAA